ncbi:flavin-containing monooxygenase [Algiphilus aromaticivorans]|uniref:flavin-containing monooxygenase n=1 Tax=Algiphilus aromaticivorans TaxID=382454 RepID=UPI0005C16E1B|nr:NAD(P)/FAD-dependent oxidoreductase [Algiphilus aromaticivorans]
MAFDAATSGPTATVESVDVLVIGTGFAGLGMAIKLKEAGMRDFVVLERDTGVAGTWRANHYPGCACDVQSHLYSFSFAPNPEWTRAFAPQPEIRRYLEGCAERYELLPWVRFGHEVTKMRWEEGAARWLVSTRNGARFSARAVVSGMGGLSNPAIPEIDGAADFAGETFHSATWRHDVDLRGKRVAVIGTGASAIQFVPQIVPEVEHLDLYQRSAAWIMPKPDRAITGIERAIFRRFPLLQKAQRAALYARLESRALAFIAEPRLLKLVRALAKLHLRRQVPNPELRAKLTPDYEIGCKRVLISDDYYPALTLPNVDVVTDGVTRITRDGVVTADGCERPADVIIYGTGFKAQDPVPPDTIIGRDGRDITEGWAERGPQAYYGTTMAGFPNLFFIVGPNTGLGHNSMVYMIETQIGYIMDCLRTMRRDELAAIEPRAEAQQRFNEWVDASHARGTAWSTGCTSWYIHPQSGRNTTLWPGFTFAYRAAMRRMKRHDYHLLPVEAREQAGEPVDSRSL